MDAIEPIDVDRIFLYEENPRHEPLETQEEIIAQLCSDEQVFELAQSICTDGINPLEVVGLVEKPSTNRRRSKPSYEVWEGNRRICAIHLLNDPERAPSKLRARFERLARSYSPIRRVPAVIFSDHERLKFWMSNIHGGEQGGVGRKRWNADAKARSAGGKRHALSLALLDRAEDYGFITKEQRKRKLTTLDRYISNPQVKAALGLDVSDPSLVKSDLTDKDFEATLEALVKDLIAGRITSRDNTDKIRPYARTLPSRAGATTDRDNLRPIEEIGEPPQGRTATKPKPKPRKPKAPKKLQVSSDLEDALCNLKNHKLASLYHSACDVSATDHPQLVAVGIWSLIESLTSCAGRDERTSFPAFLSNKWLGDHGFPKGKSRKVITDAIGRLSDGGNSTKHHATAAVYDAGQLINDVETVTPVLIAVARAAAGKKS